jgi:hypothetical protein
MVGSQTGPRKDESDVHRGAPVAAEAAPLALHRREGEGGSAVPQGQVCPSTLRSSGLSYCLSVLRLISSPREPAASTPRLESIVEC